MHGSRSGSSEVFSPRISKPLKELVQIQVECLGDLFERPHADFLVSVFQFREVLPRQFGMVRQHGLGPFAFRSQNANPSTDPHANVRCHASSMAVC